MAHGGTPSSPDATGVALPNTVTLPQLPPAPPMTLSWHFTCLSCLLSGRQGALLGCGVLGYCGAQRGLTTHLFNHQAVLDWSLCDGMERGQRPLLLTTCAVLAQSPNLSDPQFLHLQYLVIGGFHTVTRGTVPTPHRHCSRAGLEGVNGLSHRQGAGGQSKQSPVGPSDPAASLA